MKRTIMAMGLALAVVGLTALSGCVEDYSAPNRRGLERPALGVGPGGADNAEKRALEAPQRDAQPERQEYPGQSRGPSVGSVVTLADMAPATAASRPAATAAASQPVARVLTNNDLAAMGLKQAATGVPGASVAIGTANAPEQGLTAMACREDRHLSIPGRAIPVPWADGRVLEANWGEVGPLPEYRHRAWPEQHTMYVVGDVKGNPVYFESLLVAWDYYDPSRCVPCHSSDAGMVQDLKDLADVPWAFAETLALPVLMVEKEPLAQETTWWPVSDRVYEGYLPATGPVIAAPQPGEIEWTHETVAPPPENSGN